MTSVLETALQAVEQTAQNNNLDFTLLDRLGYSPAADSPNQVKNLWLVRQSHRLEAMRQRAMRYRKARIITHEQWVEELRKIDQMQIEVFNYLTQSEAA
jgi:hypothetical protein